MKKRICLLLCCVVLIIAAGCESRTADDPAPAAPENPIVDLTVLSSTMVYSEVYHMMVTPGDFIGKTVKMQGTYTTFYDEAKQKRYDACVIQDATACCAQGIEFLLTDDYAYPDDYPIDGDTICVTGSFDTYHEDNYTYCVLKNASLVDQSAEEDG